jgi:hypothetical protein
MSESLMRESDSSANLTNSPTISGSNDPLLRQIDNQPRRTVGRVLAALPATQQAC